MPRGAGKMNKSKLLKESLEEITVVLQEKYYKEFPKDKWITGPNYIAHRANRKQNDIIKSLWSIGGEVLLLSVSFLPKEEKVAIIDDFLALLNKKGMTCVVEANHVRHAVGDNEDYDQLLELINAYSRTSAPESVVKVKAIPIIDKEGPCIQIKAKGEEIILLRTLDEVKDFRCEQERKSENIKNLKNEIIKEVALSIPDVRLIKGNHIHSQGVNFIFNIREVTVNDRFTYRHRVNMERWDSDVLIDKDVMSQRIIKQIKKNRLNNLFI